MSEPLIQPVPLTVRGTTYNLVLDFAGLLAAEKETNVNMLQVFELRELDMRGLQALLRAALLRMHPEVMPVDILQTAADVNDAITAVMEAYRVSLGEPPEGEEPEKNAEERETSSDGTTSGATPASTSESPQPSSGS